MTSFGLEYTGLRETSAALKKAGVADDAVKDAMQAAGMIVRNEAMRYVPVRTGKLAGSIKVNRAKNLIKITAGNNTTVKYAYTFHAQALGKSRGGFTFRVGAHNRRGSSVRAYTANRYIQDRPFLFKAWLNKREEFLEAYVTAIADLFKGARSG